jgi:hypothetical protein
MSGGAEGDGWDRDSEDAEIIRDCIADLMRDDPGDDRFRIFDAICYHTENLFGAGVPLSMTPEDEEWLLGRPGAAALLGYFVNALVAYNAVNGREKEHPDFATTSAKREALASAFRLVNKKGERHRPIDELMAEDLYFERLLGRTTSSELAKGGSRESAIRAGRAQALKEFFYKKYGHRYVEDDDSDRSRMKLIRKQFEALKVKTPQGDGK